MMSFVIGLVFALGIETAVTSTAQEAPPSGVKPSESPFTILDRLLHETPKPNYGVPVPAQVSGRVVLHAEGKTSGAIGVSVTDGYSVVKTDTEGAYTLTPDARAVFVYLTRPGGYDVDGTWYEPLSANVNFALTSAVRDEDEYTFVHVTDTHMTDDRAPLEGLSQFVREVNGLSPAPRFVVNSGDLVSLSKTLSGSPETGHTWFRNYVGIMNHLTMPYYNVAGDHTDSPYRIDEFPRGDIRCGKPMYWEYLGPNFFSFEYGKIHFMSVDFVYHLGEQQIRGKEYPTNEVQPMHAEWMRQDMANRTPDSFVVTASESDLGKHCPGFVEMAKQHDVRLQLTGDDHVVAYESRFVPYRTGGALAGCWWNPKTKQLCPDLSPAGYLVYHVKGEEMTSFYKGEGQRVAIVSHRIGAPWKGAVTIQAHVVQPKPDETLEYSLNDGEWKMMQEISRPFYRALYETTIDSTTLRDGFVNLRVRSSLTEEERTRRFVVVNGATLPPSQGDVLLTFTVGKVSYGPQKAPAGKVDVLLNDEVIGVLEADSGMAYSFRIPASSLKTANTLRFDFAEPDDGMALTRPLLTYGEKTFEDPREEAVRQVRVAHWGAAAADWGGFIVGDGGLEEGPFRRRQQVFCFVLSDAGGR